MHAYSHVPMALSIQMAKFKFANAYTESCFTKFTAQQSYQLSLQHSCSAVIYITNNDNILYGCA